MALLMLRHPRFWLPGLVCAAALLALMLAAANPVSAAGEPIRVIFDQPMVHFSQGVDFSVTLDSEVEIVDVRLHYRVAGSSVWTYTRPEFDPSQRVEANTRVATTGMSYLPPGTEVEYFYSVLDAAGNMHRTPRSSFAYVDDRFEWEVSSIGPLSLQWHGQSDSRVAAVTREIESSINRIMELLDIDSSKPMTGVIYNSFTEAQRALPVTSPILSERHVFQGFAFSDQRAFVGVGMEPDLIVHEAAHLLLDDALPRPWSTVPAWVNEGFASYSEPGAHRSFSTASRRASVGTLPLRHMSAIPGRPSEIGRFYGKSESVVGYLIESQGEDSFRLFIHQLGSGVRQNEALRSVYGFNLDGLDQRWSGSSQPAPREAPSPQRRTEPTWAYLEGAMLGGLAVLVAVVVLGRAFINRLWRRPEGPDMEEYD